MKNIKIFTTENKENFIEDLNMKKNAYKNGIGK